MMGDFFVTKYVTPVILEALFMHVVFLLCGVEIGVAYIWGICILVERGYCCKRSLDLGVKNRNCEFLG